MPEPPLTVVPPGDPYPSLVPPPEEASSLDPGPLPLDPPVLPPVVMPMVPGGVSEPFDSTEHLFEVRWDGLRALAFVEGGGYHLQDQAGRNITELFPELGELPRRVGADQVIIDGCVVISDSSGRPDFAALDRRMRTATSQATDQAAARQPAAYVVFDILYQEARSVMSLSLLRRRKLLKRVIRAEGRICLSDAVAGDGVSFFEAARDLGIDAVIAKRKDGPYLPGGRTPSWLLVQDVPRQDVVVLGYVPDPSGGFETLLVGIFAEHRPMYAGAVGGGFDQRTMRLLAQALPGLRGGSEAPLNADRVPPDAVWVRPELVVSVKFSEWTAEGILRFPIFVGLHPEVDPRACIRQHLVPPRPRGRRRRLVLDLPQLPFAADS
jgi:bifunctional non-homologous end joining protein LigD